MENENKAEFTIVEQSKKQKETILKNLEKRTYGRVKDYSRVTDAIAEFSKKFAEELEQHTASWIEAVKSKRFKAAMAEERSVHIASTIEYCEEQIEKLEEKKSIVPDMLKGRCPDKVHASKEHKNWIRQKWMYSDIPKSHTFHARQKGGALRYDIEGKPVMMTTGNIIYKIMSFEHKLEKAYAEYAAIASKFNGKYMNELHKIFK